MHHTYVTVHVHLPQRLRDLIESGGPATGEASNMLERIELGATVRHKLTGFQGVVAGRTDYLHGSSVLLVTSPELKDGAPNMHWLEESGLELVGPAKS